MYLALSKELVSMYNSGTSFTGFVEKYQMGAL
jgi:hypothetical protein